MKAKTYKAPFDVYDSYGKQMLTDSAHLQIDKERMLAMIPSLIQNEQWLETPNPYFDGAKPRDLLESHDGQKRLMDFIKDIGHEH